MKQSARSSLAPAGLRRAREAEPLGQGAKATRQPCVISTQNRRSNKRGNKQSHERGQNQCPRSFFRRKYIAARLPARTAKRFRAVVQQSLVLKAELPVIGSTAGVFARESTTECVGRSPLILRVERSSSFAADLGAGGRCPQKKAGSQHFAYARIM